MQRNSTLLLGLVIIIGLFTACNKDNDQPDPGEYLLVVTNTTSQVPDSKMRVYKISAGNSYQSIIDQGYTFEGTDIDFTALSPAQHDSLKNFLFTLPLDSLEASGKEVFGCPGCAEGLAWLLGYKAPDGELQEWHIAYDAVPSYLQAYLEELYQVTQHIK